MNLRKAERYSVKAAVSFWWDSDGEVQEAGGTTRDISSYGVFVVSTLLPPIGEYLEIDVYLPSLPGTEKSIEMHGGGKVVRASTEGSETGFAAQIELWQTEQTRAIH